MTDTKQKQKPDDKEILENADGETTEAVSNDDKSPVGDSSAGGSGGGGESAEPEKGSADSFLDSLVDASQEYEEIEVMGHKMLYKLPTVGQYFNTMATSEKITEQDPDITQEMYLLGLALFNPEKDENGNYVPFFTAEQIKALSSKVLEVEIVNLLNRITMEYAGLNIDGELAAKKP